MFEESFPIYLNCTGFGCNTVKPGNSNIAVIMSQFCIFRWTISLRLNDVTKALKWLTSFSVDRANDLQLKRCLKVLSTWKGFPAWPSEPDVVSQSLSLNCATPGSPPKVIQAPFPAVKGTVQGIRSAVKLCVCVWVCECVYVCTQDNAG